MQICFVLAIVASVVNGDADANPAAFAESLALEHGSEFANSMGEVAMLFPDDREWSEEAEIIAPCGSYASVVNRTDFPIDDGFVSLVAKSDKAWSISLKISYKKDPKDNSDFDEWANGNVTNDIDIGHTCFYMPDQPSSINTGDVATIQLMYMALEDESNETHYACADIKFVEESVFKVTENALTCFNATDDNYYSYSDYGDEDGTSSSKSTNSGSSSGSSSTSASSSSKSSSSSSTGAATAVGVIGIFGLGAAAAALVNVL
ncbi:hypothetical protein FOA43_001363 [Brettanomyces nanus]|uniref:Copper acquisition factor BIM1-like domain-containing protein n=1 Tax=Eeniella nana TaxID=13502 RepID=A0A875S445_EENNA|nr:uncharacterized protein FOA43_001363 [Brettanomyces nanus]QPG74044.1 hypothetical protein FOA43_001363 [Brettanomyces nanus]